MFKHLLVPLDGSRLAEAVLPAVESLATRLRADVLLLHIRERGAPAEVHGERHLREPGEAGDYLEALAERLRAEGISVTYHVHDVPEGDVARSIVAHAEEEDIDLIVLSTHGSGRVRDVLVGSIAQQVLNRGATPVLLTRPEPDGSARPFEPHTVLVPLDATADAELALEPASELAGLFGARLHLVMVVPTPETIHDDRIAAATLLPAATRAALDLEQQDALRYLEDLAEHLDPRGAAVSTEVRRGDIASTLSQEAAEPGVGLIVLATHGRAGLQAIWARSVAARLLSRTRAPVLLLRRVDR
jgi:nucleotide-binding universal stress UspA family protein